MGSASPLAGSSILVVEDEPLIALWLTALCKSLGAEAVSVPTHAEACRALERGNVRAAVLDYLVRDGDVRPLCRLLKSREIPFMFHSGCDELRAAFPDNLIVPKPAPAHDLVAALHALVAPPAMAMRVLDATLSAPTALR